MMRVGLLLHGSTAEGTWLKVIRAAWLSEKDQDGGVRQGLGLEKQRIFLSDLFEEIIADGKIPQTVRTAYPALTRSEYESATFLMWLILSSCQYFSGLASVENGGKLDRAAMDELVDGYVSKLKLFKDDPYGYLGLERPNSEPSAAPNRRLARRRRLGHAKRAAVGELNVRHCTYECSHFKGSLLGFAVAA